MSTARSRERYSDFTVKHFHEQLVRRHNYKLRYTVTLLSLQAGGLIAKAKRQGTHCKKRARRPLPEVLLLQDGLKHRWMRPRSTISISSSPSTMPRGDLFDVPGRRRRHHVELSWADRDDFSTQPFGALYTDRGGHYLITRTGESKVDKKDRHAGRPRPFHNSASPCLILFAAVPRTEEAVFSRTA